MLTLFCSEAWMIILGLGVLGFSAFIAIIPLFPEITDVVKETYSNMNQLNLYDKVSSLYTNAFAVGNIFGPMMGAQLTEVYGFQRCCDILAIVTIAHFFLYFFVSESYTFMFPGLLGVSTKEEGSAAVVQPGQAAGEKRKGQTQYADLECEHELQLEDDDAQKTGNDDLNTNGSETLDSHHVGSGPRPIHANEFEIIAASQDEEAT